MSVKVLYKVNELDYDKFMGEKYKFTSKGFMTFIEFLPVLDVVKKQPLRAIYIETSETSKEHKSTCCECKKEFTYKNNTSASRKYCSETCRSIVRKRRYYYVTNEEKVRFCIVCETPMSLGTDIICSEKCKSINIKNQRNTKNPFPLTSLTENRYPHEPDVMGACYVDPDILEQAILYTDCATDIENGGYACAIYEDMAELDRIMMYELQMKPTRYEKRHKAVWSGQNYQKVKQKRNYRRKQLGLGKVPSIRNSNLDKQLAETNERRHGKRPKLKFSKKELQYRAEEAGIISFTKITPMTTKSGRLVADVLDAVQRKKLAGEKI
jgi:predicted nucleic acid-binding Zn ribbon protein